MYIQFHGCIFDPAQIVFAATWVDGMEIALVGYNEPLLIRDESATVEELFQILQRHGVAEPAAEEVELSEDTTLALRSLHEGGYSWLAMDVDGKVFAYRNNPQCCGGYWENGGIPLRIQTKELIALIDDEEKPVNIMELLLGT